MLSESSLWLPQADDRCLFVCLSRKVPWEDLRYLFGEIMYGGHITDDWDRRLCRTYLEEYMNPTMVRADSLAGTLCLRR